MATEPIRTFDLERRALPGKGATARLQTVATGTAFEAVHVEYSLFGGDWRALDPVRLLAHEIQENFVVKDVGIRGRC
jgi:hypothetical protein